MKNILHVLQIQTSSSYLIFFPGLLTHIDAGGSHVVAGIINGAVRCLPQSKIIRADVNNEVVWDSIDGEMKQIACCRWGCWAVNEKGQAFFRHGITEDSCVGSSWTEEGRGFSKIEAGTGEGVYGLSNDYRIYRRYEMDLEEGFLVKKFTVIHQNWTFWVTCWMWQQQLCLFEHGSLPCNICPVAVDLWGGCRRAPFYSSLLISVN